MKMFKTTPAQAGGSIELLRLLAKAGTTANATATSTAKSGEPLLSNTNTGSPHPKLIVGLRLSRREIVSHDTRRAMALLNGLRQEKAIAWIARGNLVLSVDGYDNDHVNSTKYQKSADFSALCTRSGNTGSSLPMKSTQRCR